MPESIRRLSTPDFQHAEPGSSIQSLATVRWRRLLVKVRGLHQGGGEEVAEVEWKVASLKLPQGHSLRTVQTHPSELEPAVKQLIVLN